MYTIDSIYSFLEENFFSFYGSGDVRGDWRDQLCGSLLHSIPPHALGLLLQRMELSETCPSKLYYKTKGIRESKLRADRGRLEVSTLIEWYCDKKSHRVCFAAKTLMEKYSDESQESKEAILRTFLTGGKKEMEWAARRLKYNWVESFSCLVAERWLATRSSVLAYLVLSRLPEEFILAHQEELAEDVPYAALCARLGGNPDFKVDWSGLSITDSLYVAAKTGNPFYPEAIEKMLSSYFSDEEMLRHPDTGLIFWSLGQIGMLQTILDLFDTLKARQ